MQRTVLITGCSTGIGRATAERFHRADWEVYATARDPADVRDLDERGVRTAELDVRDPGAAESLVTDVSEEQGRIDCLVNNAGYGQFGAVEDVPMDRIVEQFEVNTFGPLRLVHAALPRMRAAGRGRIINVGAGVGGLTPPGLGVYTGSKYALHSMSDALRQELSGTGVDVAIVEPGIVATDFYDRAMAELERIDRTPAYDALYRVLDDVDVVERGGPGISRPKRVAETIFEAATADAPSPVYRVGLTATVGTLFGGLVRGRLRDTVFRAGVRGLSSGPAQWLLERRR